MKQAFDFHFNKKNHNFKPIKLKKNKIKARL